MTQTVPDQVRRVQYIVTVPPQTIFTYPFRIFANTDLDVYSNGVLQALGVDYTVTGVDVDTGGTVVFVVGRVLDDIITIVGNMPLDRVTDFTSGNFSTDLMNTELDRIVVMNQQTETTNEQLVPRYPTTSVVTPQDTILPVLPAQTAGNIPVWSKDANGDLIAVVLEEGSGFSDLRAELADNSTPASSGSNIVGHNSPGPLIIGATTVAKMFDDLLLELDLIRPKTGNLKPIISPVTEPGWILFDELTIGNAASGATNRADADTLDLFTLLWDNCTDANCPVSGGRGASAAADFAANKTIRLPLNAGRAVGKIGGSFPDIGEVTGAETHTLITAEIPSHDHPPLSPATQFYVEQAASSFNLNPTGGNIDTRAGTTGPTGGDGAHNNMQPTVFVNWIIKL